MTECSRFWLAIAGEMEGLEGHPSELITSAPGSPALKKMSPCSNLANKEELICLSLSVQTDLRNKLKLYNSLLAVLKF